MATPTILLNQSFQTPNHFEQLSKHTSKSLVDTPKHREAASQMRSTSFVLKQSKTKMAQMKAKLRSTAS